AQWLGIGPIDLFRDVSDHLHRPLLRWWGDATPAVIWVAADLAVALVGLGAARVLRVRPAALAVVAAAGPYRGALRWGRALPYGEFKLLSFCQFLFPCLAAAGAGWLWRKRGAPQLLGRIAGWGGTGAAVVYGGVLVATQIHIARFLLLPWGAALSDADM